MEGLPAYPRNFLKGFPAYPGNFLVITWLSWYFPEMMSEFPDNLLEKFLVIPVTMSRNYPKLLINVNPCRFPGNFSAGTVGKFIGKVTRKILFLPVNVALGSKSSSRNIARASGVQIICTH